MEETERETEDTEPRWVTAGPPYLLTRAELLNELHNRGFKISEAQIRSWVTQGILERPERRVPPGAKDRVARALYPLWVIGMIYGILERMQRGSSLEELKQQAPALAELWKKQEQLFTSEDITVQIIRLPVSPGVTRALERAVWNYIDPLTQSSGKKVVAATLTLEFEDGGVRTVALRPYPMNDYEKSKEYLIDS